MLVETYQVAISYEVNSSTLLTLLTSFIIRGETPERKS
jgi:hypothetical protein